jgi:hypothetical protein
MRRREFIGAERGSMVAPPLPIWLGQLIYRNAAQTNIGKPL